MARIIGVKYIGLKDEVEDSVTNSGAVWKQGEVHNFAESLARQLLVHTDSFEQVQPSMDGENYLSGKINGRQVIESATYMNLNVMSAEQLAHYAHVEFNKRISVSDKTIEQLRAEVQVMMSIATLDEIERQDYAVESNGGKKAVINVSDAEHAALSDGTLVVRLVPAEAQSIQGITVAQAREILEEHGVIAILDNPADYELLSKNAPLLRDAYVALRDFADVLSEPIQTAGLADASKSLSSAVTAEGIAGMNKVALTDLAAASGIEINPDAPAVTLRKQLIAALITA